MSVNKFNYGDFQVEDTGNCELKVTDGKNVVTITLDSRGADVYRVHYPGGGPHTAGLPHDAVNMACEGLLALQRSAAFNKEEACLRLRRFVEDLNSTAKD